MPIPIGLAIAAGAGLLKTGAGVYQQAKGKKMLKKAIDPGYKIPKAFGQNVGQAEQLAKTGLPSEQYNRAQQNILRNVGTATRQLGRSSNPSAGLASLVRGQNDALLNLDVSNAQARRQNIMQAMSARREMAGQQLAQQQYAQNRYFDKVNEANARIGAGTQNLFGGLSDIGAAGIASMGIKGDSVTGGQQVNSMNSFDSSKYLSGLGMPPAGSVNTFGSYPFSNTGGMSNMQRITQMNRLKTLPLLPDRSY